MAGVPQQTLNWLYDVLKREYRDPNRTYSDLVHVLTRNPSFAPRTDVYTSEHGSSALLLVVRGTVPVTFRGTTYRFPVAIWVPHAYPYEAPMCYVTPTDDMVIRPGQHVSGDGRIYHPYLAGWRESWERANMLEFLAMVADIFAKEPPVTARLQQRPAQPTPPPRPPLPGDIQQPIPRHPSTMSPLPSHQYGAPPPPPKHPSQGGSSSPQPRPGRYDAPPPLPPQPEPYGNGDAQRAPSVSYAPQRSSSLRHSMPPPLPGQQMGYGQDHRGQAPPPGPAQQYQQQQPPPPQAYSQGYDQSRPPNQYQQQPGPSQPGQRPISQHYPTPQQGQPQYHPHQGHPQQPPVQQPKPQAPNLLDSPFDLPLPSTAAPSHHNPSLPAPPIPANPEKQSLLTHLSHLLTSSLHSQIAQSTEALGPLSTQHEALRQTQFHLSNDLSTLQALKSILSPNITTLQSSLSSADATIESARQRSKRNDVPKIDDLLLPPTVVSRQLYDVTCEEAGYDAAILALQEGFVRGRVGSEVWARRTRECAREGFRRRWVGRKCAQGMGLDLDADVGLRARG